MCQNVCARDHCVVPRTDSAGKPQRKRGKGLVAVVWVIMGSLRITSVSCK